MIAHAHAQVRKGAGSRGARGVVDVERYDLHYPRRWTRYSAGARDKRAGECEVALSTQCQGMLGVLFLSTQYQDHSGSYSHLVGVPKALLPASTDQYGDTILDCWWKALKRSEPPQEYVCIRLCKHTHSKNQRMLI